MVKPLEVLIDEQVLHSKKSIGVICCNKREYLELCHIFDMLNKTWCNGESYIESNLYEQLNLDSNDRVILGNDGQYVIAKDVNAEGENIFEYYDEFIGFSSLFAKAYNWNYRNYNRFLKIKALNELL